MSTRWWRRRSHHQRPLGRPIARSLVVVSAYSNGRKGRCIFVRSVLMAQPIMITQEQRTAESIGLCRLRSFSNGLFARPMLSVWTVIYWIADDHSPVLIGALMEPLHIKKLSTPKGPTDAVPNIKLCVLCIALKSDFKSWFWMREHGNSDTTTW